MITARRLRRDAAFGPLATPPITRRRIPSFTIVRLLTQSSSAPYQSISLKRATPGLFRCCCSIALFQSDYNQHAKSDKIEEGVCYRLSLPAPHQRELLRLNRCIGPGYCVNFALNGCPTAIWGLIPRLDPVCSFLTSNALLYRCFRSGAFLPAIVVGEAASEASLRGPLAGSTQPLPAFSLIAPCPPFQM